MNQSCEQLNWNNLPLKLLNPYSRNVQSMMLNPLTQICMLQSVHYADARLLVSYDQKKECDKISFEPSSLPNL